jgi:hypothetical protein
LHFQGETTNACAFLLINEYLNKDKELNLTINHRSPSAKRFTNYVLKTGMEEVLYWSYKNSWMLTGTIKINIYLKYSEHYAIIILIIIHSHAGTNQHVAEAGCHTNAAGQEWAVIELKRQLERQRLAGAFGEASPVR